MQKSNDVLQINDVHGHHSAVVGTKLKGHNPVLMLGLEGTDVIHPCMTNRTKTRKSNISKARDNVPSKSNVQCMKEGGPGPRGCSGDKEVRILSKHTRKSYFRDQKRDTCQTNNTRPKSAKRSSVPYGCQRNPFRDIISVIELPDSANTSPYHVTESFPWYN